jgi:hypothetical protein
MRAWIHALVVGLSLGCSSGGNQNDGGSGGQAGGVAGRGGGAAGHTGGAGGQAGTAPVGGGDGGISFCARLSGATFMSLDQLECGRGPDGGARCQWRINFTSATIFDWQHSDFVESGTYTCAGNTITAQRQSGGPITATFDSATQRLTWDGVLYASS